MNLHEEFVMTLRNQDLFGIKSGLRAEFEDEKLDWNEYYVLSRIIKMQ